MLSVIFYDLNTVEDQLIDFAVVVTNYQNQWVFCKHKERETWEIPGGKRELNEKIMETAGRELYEETGAVPDYLEPICIYSVKRDEVESFGQLFYAEVTRFNEKLNHEIGEIKLFEELPHSLTYPLIQPSLFQRVKQQINQ